MARSPILGRSIPPANGGNAQAVSAGTGWSTGARSAGTTALPSTGTSRKEIPHDPGWTRYEDRGGGRGRDGDGGRLPGRDHGRQVLRRGGARQREHPRLQGRAVGEAHVDLRLRRGP